MRRFVIGLALVALAGGAVMAQQGGAPEADKTFTSAADVQALIAKAQMDIKPDQVTLSQRILHLAPYNANLEYRRAGATPQAAAVHENESEFFYVIDGSGVMTTGGKLVNEKRTNPTNLSGSAIEGGKDTPLAKGDFMVVPEGTPHWISKINGAISLMTLHVPRPVPTK